MSNYVKLEEFQDEASWIFDDVENAILSVDDSATVTLYTAKNTQTSIAHSDFGSCVETFRTYYLANDTDVDKIVNLIDDLNVIEKENFRYVFNKFDNLSVLICVSNMHVKGLDLKILDVSVRWHPNESGRDHTYINRTSINRTTNKNNPDDYITTTSYNAGKHDGEALSKMLGKLEQAPIPHVDCSCGCKVKVDEIKWDKKPKLAGDRHSNSKKKGMI